MVRVITQETFEDVVKENMEEFDMEYAEAVRYTTYSTLLFRIWIWIRHIKSTNPVLFGSRIHQKIQQKKVL